MADFRIETGAFKAMSFRVQSQLRHLTLGLEGHHGTGMMKMLQSWTGYFDVWVAFDGDVAVAWSLRTHTSEGHGRGYDWDEPREGEVMTYVHPEYRRMGIGSTLIEAVDEAHGDENIMFPWSEESKQFYGKTAETWVNGWE
jgi:GNAT superfamily N-acetyltransferase